MTLNRCNCPLLYRIGPPCPSHESESKLEIPPQVKTLVDRLRKARERQLRKRSEEDEPIT